MFMDASGSGASEVWGGAAAQACGGAVAAGGAGARGGCGAEVGSWGIAGGAAQQPHGGLHLGGQPSQADVMAGGKAGAEAEDAGMEAEGPGSSAANTHGRHAADGEEEKEQGASNSRLAERSALMQMLKQLVRCSSGILCLNCILCLNSRVTDSKQTPSQNPKLKQPNPHRQAKPLTDAADTPLPRPTCASMLMQLARNARSVDWQAWCVRRRRVCSCNVSSRRSW